MSEKTNLLRRLKASFASRASYTRAVVGVNVASQIKAMRLRRNWKQDELALVAGMKQSRISLLERPGDPVSIKTLVELAAAFRVGLVVKFVPFSEMIKWKNIYRQDSFDAVPIEEDMAFIEPNEASDTQDKLFPFPMAAIPSGDATWRYSNKDRALDDSVSADYFMMGRMDNGDLALPQIQQAIGGRA